MSEKEMRYAEIDAEVHGSGHEFTVIPAPTGLRP